MIGYCENTVKANFNKEAAIIPGNLFDVFCLQYEIIFL